MVLVILLEKENLGEILTDEEIKKIVSAGFSAPLEYVRTVHFNQIIKKIQTYICTVSTIVLQWCICTAIQLRFSLLFAF